MLCAAAWEDFFEGVTFKFSLRICAEVDNATYVSDGTKTGINVSPQGISVAPIGVKVNPFGRSISL